MGRRTHDGFGTSRGLGVDIFRSYGAVPAEGLSPTACAPSTGSGQAVGCILSPLRGWDSDGELKSPWDFFTIGLVARAYGVRL